MAEKGIEVFQELRLKPHSTPASTRDHLLAQIVSPWRHDLVRENDLRQEVSHHEDVIVLIRAAFDSIDESALVLWQYDNEYRVANIVPQHVGELGMTNYNAILQDFVTRVVKPAGKSGDFDMDLTPATRSLDDWLTAEPAAALRRFSRAANKSTGASHPKDRERWLEFLIAAHRESVQLEPDLLARWLYEVDRWPEAIAQSLATDYEFARDLLTQYDHNTP